MKKFWMGLGIFVTVTTLLISCTDSEEVETPVETQALKTFTSESLYQLQESPKCKFLLDSYCNYLHSPAVSGNLQVKRAQSSTKVLQGETANDFSQVFYQYSKAKLKNRNHLPKDLFRILVKYDYFLKLEEFLNRKSRVKMSVSERAAGDKLDYELASIWSVGVNETVLNRISQKFPGFHQIPDRLMPIELSLESRRIRRNLISEISRGIWRGNKNWANVEDGFARLQKSYLSMIAKLDIPEQVRNDWSQRIREVKLVLPGSFPAISNEECSTTRNNAYYYTYLNVVTVCAGDFNSEDIIQTLAHEMSHALAIDRTQYLFQIRSDFGKELASLRTKICEPKTFSCGSWKDYKAKFKPLLSSLNGYKPEVPNFQSCLKRRDTANLLTASDSERFARTITADRISGLASSDRFLRITKSEVPMKNGKSQKNPNYLNPCSYSMWSQGEEPIDDELTTLVYFTAEYRCSEESPIDRMRSAIELSKAMSNQVLEKTIAIEGEYSARTILESEGFASPNFERFADVIGSYAMAELLLELPNKWDRQNKFLASSSWQCLEPSLASHFPEESAIEKEYIFEAHTEGDQRRKELFSKPIRDAISCEKDFEFNECALPFKK